MRALTRTSWFPISKVRRSQLVTTFGPGSIIDTRGDSAMLKGLASWPVPGKEYKIHDERLEAALDVAFFFQPPPAPDGDGNGELLPVVKFPAFHHCPACTFLTDDFTAMERKRDGVRCPRCKKGKMVPARFIAACPQGHAQDFPFREWCHGAPTACQMAMTMRTRGMSSGLRDISIACECGKWRTMEGAFSGDALKKAGVSCLGDHPWGGPPSPNCKETPRTLQRGASNFYFAETLSSLSVPPWEGKVADIVKRFRMVMDTDPNPDDLEHQAILGAIIKLKSFAGVQMDDVRRWVDETAKILPRYRDTQSFKSDEFRAFSRAVSSDSPDPRFVVREVPVSEGMKGFVQQVVLVDSMVETRALRGFRRIDPWAPPTAAEGEHHAEDGLVELKEDSVDWLPAVRLSGEGIFIRFRNEPLGAWAGGAVARAKQLQSEIDRRLVSGRGRKVTVTPQLLLLHSFSHSLMNQLSLECGYSSGALRERIYCGDADMAAVLVYTGSTDSEGTLGGLVSMGEGETLEGNMRQAIARAAWCSSDPICSETKNMGERTMNLAACHACLFVPETACEFFNSFLDRQALIGNLDGNGGFFEELLHAV